MTEPRRIGLAAAALVTIMIVGWAAFGRLPGPVDPVASPLTIEEYPLVAAEAVKDDLISLLNRTTPDMLAVRSAWREHTTEARLAAANTTLERFGYRIGRTETGYMLFHSEKIVLDQFPNFGPVTASARGDDFFFLAFSPADWYYQVQAAGVQEWEPSAHRFISPVYAGNELTSVRKTADGVGVWQGSRQIFTAKLKQPAFGNEIKSLTAWQDQWVLEVDGQVYIDGHSLNQEIGADEVFHWKLIDGKPFYFFRKGDRIGISYGGREMPHQYQQVLHYGCCEGTALNPRDYYDFLLAFYALKDGTWHYVEAGLYPAD